MMNLTLDSVTNVLCFLNVFVFFCFCSYGMRLNRIGMIRIIGENINKK